MGLRRAGLGSRIPGPSGPPTMPRMAIVQEMVRRAPSPRLAPYIRNYNGWSYSGLAAGTHRGLPSGNLTFIVSLDGPISLVSMPGAQGPAAFHGFVGGLHLKPAIIAHPGHGAGFSVELSPLGARQLLGVPSAPLASFVVDLRDLLGQAGDRLVERVHTADGWDARFTVVEEELSAVVDDSRTVAPEIARVWAVLAASGGRIPISNLADEVGWSRRTLSTRFGDEMGVTPKEAARVLRFQRACDLLDRGMPLAEAAALGGYYDQSHMTSEWRALSGVTPTEWKSDELRDRSVAE